MLALRVPWAFFVRDLRIEASLRGSLAMRLASPVVAVLVFYFLSLALRGPAATAMTSSGVSYFAFAVVGLALLAYVTAGITAVAEGIRESQRTGALEHLVLSRVRLSTMLLAASLPGYAIAGVTAAIYLIAGGALGVRFSAGAIPFALLSLALATVSFVALGLFAVSFVLLTKRGNPLGWAIRTSSIVLGGVFYPVSVLPEGLRLLAQALPVQHILDALRGSLLLGQGMGELWPDLLALAIIAAVLLPLSLLACRIAVRIARTDGSLCG